MKTNQKIDFLLFFVTLFFVIAPVSAATYPMELQLVSKQEARYDTPENAYISITSAMINNDLEWYYESLTKESATSEKALYKQYNFDIQEIFDSVKDISKIIVLEKKSYENGVALLLNITNNDGSSLKGPSVFMQEDGQWKSSPNIPNDDPILDLIEYTPPPQYLTPFNTSIYPSQWPLPWYSWITEQIEHNSWAEQLADSMTILCVISDQEEDDFAVSDILPETLRLNDTVPPQPWRYSSWRKFSREERPTILFPSTTNHHIASGSMFEQWLEQTPLSNSEDQRMLVRFNLYQALQTLPDVEAGETYELTVSGMLEGDTPFKATAEITIINSFRQPETGWRWWRQNPPHHSELLENWWNR